MTENSPRTNVVQSNHPYLKDIQHQQTHVTNITNPLNYNLKLDLQTSQWRSHTYKNVYCIGKVESKRSKEYHVYQSQYRKSYYIVPRTIHKDQLHFLCLHHPSNYVVLKLNCKTSTHQRINLCHLIPSYSLTLVKLRNNNTRKT